MRDPSPPPPYSQGSKDGSFMETKALAFKQPAVLHSMLGKLADNIADYACYMVMPFHGAAWPFYFCVSCLKFLETYR